MIKTFFKLGFHSYFRVDMNLKNRINKYKNSMINIFKIKYDLSDFEARKEIEEFDFDKILEQCNYIALHDDPELWVDSIYKWANKERSDNY